MESTCSSKKKDKSHENNGLVDLVFTWKLEDILNQELYLHKVEKIPESFQSVHQYLNCYKFPLLEETRADICSSMETISQAPFAEIIGLDEAKPYGSLSYDIEIDSWKNISGVRCKEPYKPKPGDVLILADAVPEIVSDLERFGRTWTFATVTKVPDNENLLEDTPTNFKVKTSKAIQIKDGMRTSLFSIFLINITTNKRIWTALHGLGNLKILKEVLSTDLQGEEPCHICSSFHMDITKVGSLGMQASSLDDSQVAAILNCITAVHCRHKSAIKLVWGPPGTGKTKTLSTLLWSIIEMKCRTLACAPTNVAITELAARVLKLVKESHGCSAEPSKIMSFCSLGDMLLFGNNDRLKVDGDLEEIFLDYRVDRLVECFAPLTGWKHCFTTVIDFLKDCHSHYQTYLENESMEDKEVDKNNKTDRDTLSFLEFSRNRYCAAASPLRRCIEILCIHLPVALISNYLFKQMGSLLNLLEYFEWFLCQGNLSEDELVGIFRHSLDENSAIVSEYACGCDAIKCDASHLVYGERCKYLFLLKSLYNSLDDLQLPNSTNKFILMDFCFQSASIIFCTASSSYKLYSVVIKPMDLVVIDEAAQLKECESAIPLQLPGVQHAFLIGDECQLPAMVNSKVSEEAEFGRSLFERLGSVGYPKHLLNMQYRMHPQISCYPNSKFYFSNIIDAPNVRSRRYEKHYLPGPMFGPYSFISISNGREEGDDVGYSRKNLVEVAVVMKIVRSLFKAWQGKRGNLSIGIVSPYAAQVAVIQDKLGQKYEKMEGFVVRVKSIDGFQGGEEDIILISTVRSNSTGYIGFLSDPKRTNVALTRAKHCLWILGNEKTLANSDSVWSSVVCDAKNRQCFFNADEDKDLAKAILEVKKELDQLDDLLNGDSALFKTARWKVIFSDNFRRTFGNLKSSQLKKSIINLLLKLSSGWRPKKRNTDCICENSSQLAKQFKVEDLYLISTVDIMKQSMYSQVLKIWDILPLEEIPKLVKRLDNIIGMYTDEYISRCKAKCVEGSLEVPMTWETCAGVVQFKICRKTVESETVDVSNGTLDGRCYIENSNVSESLLLMKFYSLSSGVVGHLLSGRDGREIDLPFEVTDQEMEIILFPRSTFILGRSGTGKTTVLTMKLIQREQQHYIASQGLCEVTEIALSLKKRNEVRDKVDTNGTVLRQLFVTVSPKLCAAVRNQICHLKSFTCGSEVSAASSSVDMLDDDEAIDFKDIPDCFFDIPPKSYPLVITFQKFLMMLDGTLGNSYFDRFREVRELSLGKRGISRSVALQTFLRMKEVNFGRFNSLYWPHFNSLLTKNLDSSAVFTEIISYIKGGLVAGEVREGRLSKEDYVMLSESRVSSCLGKEKREIIYDIFLDYEKKRMENGDFDLADFVIDLHGRLRDGCYKGEEMDFVYIDEVQDLTMRQIAIFKYICRNVKEGFIFSGDTAQTIARGIDFRFQDIKSVFYKEFLLGCCSELKDKTKEKDQSMSEIFHLNQNFRTHAGVLHLSQSVINLIYRYFPNSIDVLSPETSFIYGEAPVLLESSKDDENAIVTIFGNAGNNKESMVGFGAEQVILVRDDCARKEIAEYVGKQALVLTVVECKGLEFQDVLLYNFFSTSPLKNKWRVVYEYMKDQSLLDSTTPKKCPRFNKAKHNVLCSELKQLYVAITRTRQRFWICENNEVWARPMFDYWKKLCVIQARQLDESLAKAMQVASSKEEWSKRGIKLFNENNFEMATMCFERAEDSYREKWSRAAGLRASADRMRASNSDHARIALMEAAEIYETIGKAELAAKCFLELKEYKRAGMLYLEKCGEARLEEAGDCFKMAQCWSLSAETYAQGNYISKCLSVCTSGELFDMALNFIKSWKENPVTAVNTVDQTQDLEHIEQTFLEKCAQHYHELKDTKTMIKFVRAFDSIDTIRTFLKSGYYLNELVSFEVESGNFMEAASIARIKGDILLEADMFAKGDHFEDASRLILSYVLLKSIWADGSKGWPLKQFTDKEELLIKVKNMAMKCSDFIHESICLEASLLSNQESSLLHLVKCFTASGKQQNLRMEIISIWKILDVHLQSQPSRFEWKHEVVLNPTKHAEQTTRRNSVSVQSLVYFWNCWRGNIAKIHEFLHSLETQSEHENASYSEFCLDYMGARKLDNNEYTIYLLGSVNPCWMREVDESSLPRKGDLVLMKGRQFANAARRYWDWEMLNVGIKVLETLDALHKFSIEKSLPIICQGTVIVYIFDVAKYIIGFNEWKCHSWALQKLQRHLMSSRQYFFGIVFPLDWRSAMTESMILLRGTSLYMALLEEVVIDNIGSKSSLTYGQIGRLVMLLLVSEKPNHELYEKIVSRFHENPPWQLFIRQLEDYLLLKAGLVSLVSKLNVALQDTFNANWRGEFDYISPHCFVYLIECYVFLFSSCQRNFFTTKFSLIESLAFENWEKKSSSSSASDSLHGLPECHEFIAYVVSQILFNKKDTLEWLGKSRSTDRHSYSLLVLRLFIVVSLIYINSGQHVQLLSSLLGRNDIRLQLPVAFSSILPGKINRNFGNLFARALGTTDNPLVIMRLDSNFPGFFFPDALVLDINTIHSREDILGILFAQDPEVQLERVEQKNTSSKTENLSLSQTVEMDNVNYAPCLNKARMERTENESKSMELVALMRYMQLGTTLDTLMSKADSEVGDRSGLTTQATKFKLNVEATIHELDALIKVNLSNPDGEKDGFLSVEAKNIVDELKQLSLALSVSGEELESNFQTIEDLHGKFVARRPKLQALIESETLQKQQKDPVEPSQINVTSVAPANTNAGKEKNKKENLKSRKGKRGKAKKR